MVLDMDNFINAITGAALLYAAIDRVNRMGVGTSLSMRVAACLLAIAGGIGVASLFDNIEVPMAAFASAGAALWLIADRRKDRTDDHEAYH